MLQDFKRLYHHQRLLARKRSRPLLRCWRKSQYVTTRYWKKQEFLVVDTETSSLEVKEGELLSIGWVTISGGQIRLDSAEHLLFKPRDSVGQSAGIHHLRDCEFENGLSQQEIMERFLEQVQGKVLVFHYAALDMGYIDQLCRELYGARLLLPVVDTLELEKKKLQRREQLLEKGALTLSQCRARYGLPDYPVHNALMDALATAELLLAQIAHRGARVRLKDLL